MVHSKFILNGFSRDRKSFIVEHHVTYSQKAIGEDEVLEFLGEKTEIDKVTSITRTCTFFDNSAEMGSKVTYRFKVTRSSNDELQGGE